MSLPVHGGALQANFDELEKRFVWGFGSPGGVRNDLKGTVYIDTDVGTPFTMYVKVGPTTSDWTLVV